MRKFNSRIGLELLLPVAFFTGYFLFNAVANSNWTGLLIISLVIAFLVYIYFSTNYTITNKFLKIQCGIFYHRLIRIDKIETIREVTDIFSAPATSVKRIEIKYNATESIAISPKDKIGFINTLQYLNPDIQFKNSNQSMIA